MLSRAGKYNDCLFHRLVPGFMVRRIRTEFHTQRTHVFHRFRRVTRVALVLAENRTGEHLSGMNTI
jgi:cyclophilin family peptidyl-prolyl cis-trans isomerase